MKCDYRRNVRAFCLAALLSVLVPDTRCAACPEDESWYVVARQTKKSGIMRDASVGEQFRLPNSRITCRSKLTDDTRYADSVQLHGECSKSPNTRCFIRDNLVFACPVELANDDKLGDEDIKLKCKHFSSVFATSAYEEVEVSEILELSCQSGDGTTISTSAVYEKRKSPAKAQRIPPLHTQPHDSLVVEYVYRSGSKQRKAEFEISIGCHPREYIGVRDNKWYRMTDSGRVTVSDDQESFPTE